MRRFRSFFAGGAVLALSACVGPEGSMMPPGSYGGGAPGGYPPPAGYPHQGYPPATNGYPQQGVGGYPMQPPQQPQPGYPGAQYPQTGYPPQQGYPVQQQPQRATPPATSDYLPHLRDEYRTAYDIGARDRSYGYLSDYKRAFTRFGRGFESYFQEGYNDGYNGARMKH